MKSDPSLEDRELDKLALDRMFVRYRAALCGSTWLMVALSWPLWVDRQDFPRIPFVPRIPQLPTWVSWLVLGLILTTLGLVSVRRVGFALPRHGESAGQALPYGICLFLLIFAIVQDQNRFQPWAYQFVLIGLAMVCMSRGRALGMARWYVVGLYFYSGVSKLDVAFCHELGPTFLSAALGPFGIEPMGWPEAWRTMACLGMPAFEITVATLLLFQSTRKLGLVGAVAQHLALVWILGPWNLGHSAIVLVWNLALIVENLILFGGTIPAEIASESRLSRLARIVFWAAMLLPVGERLGFCDAWPGHALYASHAERSDIFLYEDDLNRYPEAIRQRLGPAGVTPWRRLDLTAWSRDVRGTPLYPSGRVGNAIAEFLEARYSAAQPVRLIHWSRARAWDGVRERDESLGLRAIRRRAERFLLNAHPAGG